MMKDACENCQCYVCIFIKDCGDCEKCKQSQYAFQCSKEKGTDCNFFENTYPDIENELKIIFK